MTKRDPFEHRRVPFNWKCPFCEQTAEIGSSHYYSSAKPYGSEIKDPLGFIVDYDAIVCPNPECRKFALAVRLAGLGIIDKWQLIPESDAKVFPDYIPKVILDDYREACLVRDLSPKAAATLARRCLQGMIRDFWNVRGKHSLADEIEAIEDKIDRLTRDAINTVRKVGNIGAHMEADPNLVVDVEPREIALLIGLIERLFHDWYMSRHEHQQHLEAVKKLGEDKEKAGIQRSSE